MKLKRRYLLCVASVAFLALCYFGGHRIKTSNRQRVPVRRVQASKDKQQEAWRSLQPSYLGENENPEPAEGYAASVGESRRRASPSSSTCRMETCFNFTKCPDSERLWHYVYPLDDRVRLSVEYKKVLSALKESPLYTSDPSKACLFILAVDTLDRDPLSERMVSNLGFRIEQLPLWNNGENHIIFNLYSGTWPDYEEGLDFDIGQAILAKASMTPDHYRPGFDVSLPLFQARHPGRGGNPGWIEGHHFPVKEEFFLAFKGKRYVYGIGSETRNSLYHLHNGKDVIIATTCKHGKNWEENQDERCDKDNQEYDRWDYDHLLSNSTFCLVPRGRRVGSFRFIETLQAGCVPLLLSNGWVLPFSEVIDWSTVAVDADERLLLQVPEMLRSISQTKVFKMRQQTQVLWDRYFSSVDKIVATTLEIIHERIHQSRAREGLVWNSAPGALMARADFSDTLSDLPFFEHLQDLQIPSSSHDKEHFSAVIYVPTQSSSSNSYFSSLFHLVKNVTASEYVNKIVVLWSSTAPPPPRNRWPSMPRRISFKIEPLPRIYHDDRSVRFHPDHVHVSTDAVLHLDADAVVSPEEIDFAYSVWKTFPDRIVGFVARSHFWDHNKRSWAYTSRWLNEYSMISTSAAFVHRYYHHLYSRWLPPRTLKIVQRKRDCEDILLNFLVSFTTQKPPIKVTQRKNVTPSITNITFADMASAFEDRHTKRHLCLNAFEMLFGSMPLRFSSMRLDPVLYKDPVANTRKKYRKLELIAA